MRRPDILSKITDIISVLYRSPEECEQCLLSREKYFLFVSVIPQEAAYERGQRHRGGLIVEIQNDRHYFTLNDASQY